MIGFRVEGVGVVGPGICGRSALEARLAQGADAFSGHTEIGVPDVIHPRERRRTSATVRLALGAASEAVRDSGRDASELPMVFASSLGDGTILNELLEVLVDPERHVSPTRFHNSVHNAALAYWSIGTKNRLPGTSLAAHDFTFGAALLKSAAQLASDPRALLLVVYDHPFPEPLNQARELMEPFAAAFVLSPADGADAVESPCVTGRPSERSGCKPAPRVVLSRSASAGVEPTPPRLAGYCELWRRNPAARALPLLESILQGAPAVLDVAYRHDRTLRLEVVP